MSLRKELRENLRGCVSLGAGEGQYHLVGYIKLPEDEILLKPSLTCIKGVVDAKGTVLVDSNRGGGALFFQGDICHGYAYGMKWFEVQGTQVSTGTGSSQGITTYAKNNSNHIIGHLATVAGAVYDVARDVSSGSRAV